MNVVKETKHFLDHSLINDSDTDILTFLQDSDAEITKALEQSLLRFGKIKVNFLNGNNTFEIYSESRDGN